MSLLLSIVSPVYKAEQMVSELVSRIAERVRPMTGEYEIILVCDGSPDGSWEAIKEACKKDSRVKGINLSRNFGQHNAITAGLNYAKGDWVVVMDCDLQDRPEEIPRLYLKALEGYDIVQCRRMHRKDGFLKKLSSKAFHALFDWLSDMKTDTTIANYGIYSRKVIEAYKTMPEVARSFGSLLYHLGFRRSTIDVEHSGRLTGKSSYTFSKALRLSFDIILSNSNKPLRMAIVLGFLFSAISFLLAVYNVIARLVGIIGLEGYTTTVFSIWFVGGVILMILGVLGLYIGKIFDQVKGRPLYVVSEEINI